jgi:hypothetical protein
MNGFGVTSTIVGDNIELNDGTQIKTLRIEDQWEASFVEYLALTEISHMIGQYWLP